MLTISKSSTLLLAVAGFQDIKLPRPLGDTLFSSSQLFSPFKTGLQSSLSHAKGVPVHRCPEVLFNPLLGSGGVVNRSNKYSSRPGCHPGTGRFANLGLRSPYVLFTVAEEAGQSISGSLSAQQSLGILISVTHGESSLAHHSIHTSSAVKTIVVYQCFASRLFRSRSSNPHQLILYNTLLPVFSSQRQNTMAESTLEQDQYVPESWRLVATHWMILAHLARQRLADIRRGSPLPLPFSKAFVPKQNDGSSSRSSSSSQSCIAHIPTAEGEDEDPGATVNRARALIQRWLFHRLNSADFPPEKSWFVTFTLAIEAAHPSCPADRLAAIDEQLINILHMLPRRPHNGWVGETDDFDLWLAHNPAEGEAFRDIRTRIQAAWRFRLGPVMKDGVPYYIRERFDCLPFCTYRFIFMMLSRRGPDVSPSLDGYFLGPPGVSPSPPGKDRRIRLEKLHPDRRPTVALRPRRRAAGGFPTRPRATRPHSRARGSSPMSIPKRHRATRPAPTQALMKTCDALLVEA